MLPLYCRHPRPHEVYIWQTVDLHGHCAVDTLQEGLPQVAVWPSDRSATYQQLSSHYYCPGDCGGVLWLTATHLYPFPLHHSPNNPVCFINRKVSAFSRWSENPSRMFHNIMIFKLCYIINYVIFLADYLMDFSLGYLTAFWCILIFQ